MMTAPYTITLVWWLNYCYTWTVSATTITSRTSTMLVLYAYTIHSNRMQWQSRGFIGFGQAFHHCIKPHICNAKLTNIVLLPLRVHQCSIICRWSPASGGLPASLPELCPWTSLEDFQPPDEPPSQNLDRPVSRCNVDNALRVRWSPINCRRRNMILGSLTDSRSC